MQTSIYAQYSLNKLVNKQQYSITNKILCKAIGVSNTLPYNRWEQDNYIYNAMHGWLCIVYIRPEQSDS
jgi:ribosomal protein S26